MSMENIIKKTIMIVFLKYLYHAITYYKLGNVNMYYTNINSVL